MTAFGISRRRFFPLILLLIPTFMASVTIAGIDEWTSIGPLGDHVRAIPIDPQKPDIVYMGSRYSGYGVYKSTDGGLHWEPKNKGLSATMVMCIIINPHNTNIVYASTEDGGVFKSINGGETWVEKNKGFLVVPPVPLSVDYLAMEHEDPDRLYAARHDPYISTNGGESWREIFFQNGAVRCFAIDQTDPTVIYMGTDIAPRPGFLGGVWKSTDSGETWTETDYGIDSLCSVLVLSIAPDNNEHIYAAGFDYYPGAKYNSVYKSTDRGQSWVNINNNMNSIQTNTIVVDPINSDILYVGNISLGYAPGGIYKSTNGGQSWVRKDDGLDTDKIEKLAIDPNNPQTLYVGTWHGGVFKTTDGGESWMDITDSTMNCKYMTDLIFDPQNPSVLFAGSFDGLYRSTDKGLTWQRLKEGLPRFFSHTS